LEQSSPLRTHPLETSFLIARLPTLANRLIVSRRRLSAMASQLELVHLSDSRSSVASIAVGA